MSKRKEFSIETIANGAIPARFKRELKKVMENINDENTKPREKRKITIEINLTPNEERNVAACTVQVFSKLAKIREVETPVFMAFNGKGLVPYENTPDTPMFGEDGEANVRPLTAAKEVNA